MKFHHHHHHREEDRTWTWKNLPTPPPPLPPNKEPQRNHDDDNDNDERNMRVVHCHNNNNKNNNHVPCCSPPPPSSSPSSSSASKEQLLTTSNGEKVNRTSNSSISMRIMMMMTMLLLTMGGKKGRRKRTKEPKWIVSFVWICICVGLWINPSYGQGSITTITAVLNKKAMLPCDITPPDLTDTTILVLWYKDLGDMPIYSFDGRTQPGNHAKNELLGQRAFFRTLIEPAVLAIDTVRLDDEGVYRCRVDFQKSPTRNYRVNLSIIVPPQKPTVFDPTGQELAGIAGPFQEEASMVLTCVCTGGRPPPKLTWWRGGALIDDTYRAITGDGTVNNKLEIKQLTRSDLHAELTCQASNHNLSEPISTKIKIEMYFKPLEVSLLGSNQPVSALQEIEIVCQSVGSRPPAQLEWILDGRVLESGGVMEISPMGNISTSTLKLTPRVADHGKSLVCRASNPRLEGSAIEDTWKLAVFFVPILELALGSNLDPDNIKEADDIYFECKIKANPPYYRLTWYHEGAVVQHNASAGIIMSNQSLVLQKVKRSSGGQVICTATNIEGEGRSNPVDLSVMYKPICKAEQKRVFGVAKGEQVEIECKVDSNPKADNFKWAFNNSAESIDVPQARFSTVNSAKLASSSILSYTPMSELDYGSVICWATNIIGQQAEACVFHIIAAGKPDPPFNCSVQNITSESLEIDCIEGFDGGLPQMFLLEIVDGGSPRLLSNLTSPIPFFVVTGLRPGQSLRLFTYAVNRKGASDKIILEGQTIHEAEKRTAASQVDFELTPILGVCVGIVCGLLVVALGIVLALRFRTDSRHSPALKATKTEYRVEVTEAEDKNPDIIPSSKEPDYYYKDGLYNGPKRNGSITENFRDCTYYSDKSNAEITYAELCLHGDNTGNNSGNTSVIGPGGVGWSTVDRKRRRNPMEEPPGHTVIYATIDHCRRTNGEPPAHHLPPHQREIVSVRTPLLVSSQQESCV